MSKSGFVEEKKLIDGWTDRPKIIWAKNFSLGVPTDEIRSELNQSYFEKMNE